MDAPKDKVMRAMCVQIEQYLTGLNIGYDNYQYVLLGLFNLLINFKNIYICYSQYR